MSALLLPRTGILAYMDDDCRKLFAGYGHWISTAPGEVLLQEGAVNRHLYIVVSGNFEITTKAQGRDVSLDRVGEGDCLGEVAIFSPDRASATVTSIEAGKLWSIEAESLQKFMNDWPNCGCAAVLGINVILARRLRHANTMIRSHSIVPGFLNVRSMARTKR